MSFANLNKAIFKIMMKPLKKASLSRSGDGSLTGEFIRKRGPK
jgi:hypothetical protein